jgi:hypothetical protein
MQVSTHQPGKSCSVRLLTVLAFPGSDLHTAAARDFAWTAALCLRELREDAPALALAA